jgi:hypothetical protein
VGGGGWEVWLIEGQRGREREVEVGGGWFVDGDYLYILTIKIQ